MTAFGEITGRVTASHRDPDGTLVIDQIEIDSVNLSPAVTVVPSTRRSTISEERIAELRRWLLNPERLDAIHRQIVALRRDGQEAGSIAVPASFGEDLVTGSMVLGLPLVPAEVTEPEVRRA